MATKIKGIYTKGFKCITQIFVVKEREMEIGYPTDVKHVAHIGWDGGNASGAAPSWMNEFKSAPEFSSTTAVINTRDFNSNTLDFDESIGHKPKSHSFSDVPSSDLPSISKKQKRKKKKGSSPASYSSSSRSSRARKSKASYHEKESGLSIEV